MAPKNSASPNLENTAWNNTQGLQGTVLPSRGMPRFECKEIRSGQEQRSANCIDAYKTIDPHTTSAKIELRRELHPFELALPDRWISDVYVCAM